MATAYCVKCRDKREIKDPVEVYAKKWQTCPMKGTCPDCGTNVFRIGKNPDKLNLTGIF